MANSNIRVNYHKKDVHNTSFLCWRTLPGAFIFCLNIIYETSLRKTKVLIKIRRENNGKQNWQKPCKVGCFQNVLMWDTASFRHTQIKNLIFSLLSNNGARIIIKWNKWLFVTFSTISPLKSNPTTALLSIVLPACLSIDLLCIYLSIYLSIYPSIYLSTYLSIYLSVCLSVSTWYR